MQTEAELNLWFDHALGDNVYFAYILELYRRRGFRFNLHIDPSKAVLFAPVNANLVPFEHPGLTHVRYPETADPIPETANQYWLYNKPGYNVTCPPLPDIGTAQELWEELCSTQLNIAPHIGGDKRALVDDFLRDLPRPVVLIQSMGNTYQWLKNVPPDVALELYRQLLDRIDGTLVLLDWDDRVPRLANWRVRHLTDDWMRIDVATLVALMDASDLLISVDSGPLHLSRMTGLPAIGIFPSLNKHPARVSLPRRRSVNIMPQGVSTEIDRATRILFNVIESPGEDGFNPSFIADVACRMLSGPRYLSEHDLGADIQLQQFVLGWERGRPNALSEFNDRHRGFDLLLREITRRFPAPTIVETGSIRVEEDWEGAGFSTYLLGAFAERWGGEVVSVDSDARVSKFAESETREFRSVKVFKADPVAFLVEFGRPIDVLLLDSTDTHVKSCAKDAQAELEASMPWLHARSIVVLDDCVYRAGRFVGRGELAVPWLLSREWKILHSGYQTILSRAPVG